MTENIEWPPKSPKAALLSSPSGRKRYAEAMSHSPIKRSRTTPGLLNRLRAARADNDHLDETDDDDVVDGEEDEETLKLQLAAIEAKLRLKRMQQSKARAGGISRSGSAAGTQRTESVHISVSPTRQATKPTEPRSPSRVLLGIDKGLKGADVSLKRAKSMSERIQSNAVARTASRAERPASRIVQLSNRSNSAASTPKSFSERMAEVRDRDRARDRTRSEAHAARTSSFNVDKAEMNVYKELAEEDRKRGASVRHPLPGQSFSREEVMKAKESVEQGPKPRRAHSKPELGSKRPESQGNGMKDDPQSASSLWEGFSGISLSSRILPHSFLKRTLPEDQFTTYTIPDLLADVKSPDYEIADGVGDYVIFAIIASKSGALDQKNQVEEHSKGIKDWERQWEDGSQNKKRFIAMTLTDLKWTVDLYLFGTAVPRYHRLVPGTVIAILNPGIMPPKKGREDTGAFSLNISDGDDTILEIGTARELGFCNAMRKDGKECGSWVHMTKSEICEFHLNLQVQKAQQSRMGLNTGSNGFGGRGGGSAGNSSRGGRGGGKSGLLPHRKGARFDYETQSSFYVAQSSRPTPILSNAGPQHHHNIPFGISASRALDHDDPFISDAQLLREKKAMLQRRKERQAEESKIAEKLGTLGESAFARTGAGAEYMRVRSGMSTKADQGRESSSRVSAQEIRRGIMGGGNGQSADARGGDDGEGLGKGKSTKRTAESVRLSPVKKTRFVTDKGIRVAGRESLPGGAADVTSHDHDEDDELDIV